MYSSEELEPTDEYHKKKQVTRNRKIFCQIITVGAAK
jgi:hypothetical protein